MINSAAIDRLGEKLNFPGNPSCFCGFDGFVDEVVHTVDNRIDANNYTRIESLADYGRKIAAASGLSLNVEIVPVSKKLGGNGPIFALGLKSYGADITYVGAVGIDTVDPVFEGLAEGSTLIGIAEPARTDAMEFNDGKIIRSKLSALNGVNWDSICRYLGLERLIEYMNNSQMISFNNWTMLPHMSDIWEHILNEAIPRMEPEKIKEKLLFFDLADPEKRTKNDILHALELLKSFNSFGFKTVLGLNKKEAWEIAELISDESTNVQELSLEELNRLIANELKFSCVTIHPLEGAACVHEGRYYYAEGPYCAKPKLTTGAGDNYNTGFVFGLLQDYDIDECLNLGVASSGYYVRNAHSPNLQQIRSFLKAWTKGELD